MAEGLFKFEDDHLKHHIRTKAWLPLCRKRLRTMRETFSPRRSRRFRYFTFCAVGAVDVLMLDVARVITRAEDRGFNTVFFFDKSREAVVETQKRIPGAVGFVGDFVETVLSEYPEEEAEELTDHVDDEPPEDTLAPPVGKLDEYKTRAEQLRRNEYLNFVKSFPFDVINLDVEEYLFKPSEQLPGKLINALRKVFTWQRRLLKIGKVRFPPLEGFSLMFTTKVGPPNLSEEYLASLRDCVTENLGADAGLRRLLVNRVGSADVRAIQANNFDSFFKLSVPKVIARTLMECDWYVDPKPGIKVFEFKRPFSHGSYTMLHLVMDVRRHSPPLERRMSGQVSNTAAKAYRKVCRQVLSNAEIVVSKDSVNHAQMTRSLERVRARQRMYLQQSS